MSSIRNQAKGFGVAALTIIFAITTASVADASIISANPPGPVVVVDFNALPTNATNTQVQTYLNNALNAGGYAGTVTVQGAIGGGNYTGEGHVVGPMVGGTPVSQTLATLDGGNFIRTADDRIIMSFSQPIYGVSFDMQIFPEANNTPDFTFLAYQTFVSATNNQSIGSNVFVGSIPSGPFMHSPSSGAGGNEPFKQLLLVNSPQLVFSFPNGATRLEFVDWPPTIGVDNPAFVFGIQAEVPEPGTLVISGAALGLVAFAGWVRRRRHGRLAANPI